MVKLRFSWIASVHNYSPFRWCFYGEVYGNWWRQICILKRNWCRPNSVWWVFQLYCRQIAYARGKHFQFSLSLAQLECFPIFSRLVSFCRWFVFHWNHSYVGCVTHSTQIEFIFMMPLWHFVWWRMSAFGGDYGVFSIRASVSWECSEFDTSCIVWVVYEFRYIYFQEMIRVNFYYSTALLGKFWCFWIA